MTLVLGASENPERYSYKAARMLQQAGHPVYLVGRKPGHIGNDPIVSDFPQPASVDTLTLYIGPAGQPAFYEAVERLAPRRIIFNPGTENPAWEETLRKSGVEVERACTLVMLSTGQY